MPPDEEAPEAKKSTLEIASEVRDRPAMGHPSVRLLRSGAGSIGDGRGVSGRSTQSRDVGFSAK
jgi:hypothetical protein